MILKALTDLYEVLAEQGRVERDGWVEKPVGHEICLDRDGNLVQIVNIKQENNKGKLKPQNMPLPDWGIRRTSGIRPFFLCDSSAYIFGISKKKTDTEEICSKKRYEFHSLHHRLLDETDVPEVKAFLAFLDFIADGGELSDDIVETLDDNALSGDNFIFSVDGVRLHGIPEVQKAWDSEYESFGEGQTGICLVTGRETVIVKTHPSIRGLYGTQASGAGLSTFNPPSFCSYGKEQNLNAPVGRHAAYAYTTALTYLLYNRLYSRTLAGNDLTVVWWPEDADDTYAEFQCAAAFGDNSHWSDSDISGILDALSRGRPVEGMEPDRKFYVMGLSPNSSRITVRFFISGSFGEMVGNISNHYDRLRIAQPRNDEGKVLTVGRLLRAMVREDVDKEIPEVVIDKLFQSILFGHAYPTQMMSMTMRRLRVGDSVNWQRAAIIKAYFLRALPENDKRRENFTMSLNRENGSIGYVLGRLFALYESIQYRAINKETIHNSFFGAAMSTPATVFPRLARLSQVHMKKLSEGSHIWYDKQVTELKAMVERYPARLDIVEQGAFDIGYYHQREELFRSKKTDSASESNNSAAEAAESEEQ